MKTVTTSDVEEYSRNGNTTIINVLPEEQFDKGHIPGSINIPLEAPDFTTQVEKAVGGKNEPIVVYCANAKCPASDQAAEKLEQDGFSDVADYGPGTEGWQESGLPLSTS